MSDVDSNDWSLHPRLAADTHQVAELALCAVLLMNDADLPWLILVPRRAGLREVHHLPEQEQRLLMSEIALASRVLERLHHPHKLNVGALGNLVPQLHVHVVARYEHDRAWPGPIWGAGQSRPYSETERDTALETLRAALLQG